MICEKKMEKFSEKNNCSSVFLIWNEWNVIIGFLKNIILNVLSTWKGSCIILLATLLAADPWPTSFILSLITSLVSIHQSGVAQWTRYWIIRQRTKTTSFPQMACYYHPGCVNRKPASFVLPSPVATRQLSGSFFVH